MQSAVTIRFGRGEEVQVNLDKLPSMSPDEGRRWLDEQFVLYEVEPLRATGKVLIADKVIGLVRAAGFTGFEDLDWTQDFARAASAALGKPFVAIDLASSSIHY